MKLSSSMSWPVRSAMLSMVGINIWILRLTALFSSVLIALILVYQTTPIAESMLYFVMAIAAVALWLYVDLSSPFLKWLNKRYVWLISFEPRTLTNSNTTIQFSAFRDRYWRTILNNFEVGHYVYVIKDISVTGYYKIGRTNNPVRRLGRFEVVLPFDLHIFAIIRCVDMTVLEGQLHQHFKDKRKSGEWFDLNNADLSWLMAQYDGNEPFETTEVRDEEAR